VRDSKYSILFMRDDTDVKRLRLSPFWLRAYVVAQVLLAALAAGGVYLGYTAWHENVMLNREKHDLAKRLEEAELRLSTLGNMEKILEAYDKSELQSLLSANPGEQVPPTDAEEDGVDLTAIFTPVDEGLVVLDELKATLNGDVLTVNFKVENPKEDSTLSGVAELSLVTSSGEIHPLDAPPADLSFQIQRRKFARTSVKLPEGVKPDDAFGLRVTIKRSDGKVIFGETYPLYHILS
jgi:hypothetical protein